MNETNEIWRMKNEQNPLMVCIHPLLPSVMAMEVAPATCVTHAPRGKQNTHLKAESKWNKLCCQSVCSVSVEVHALDVRSPPATVQAEVQRGGPCRSRIHGRRAYTTYLIVSGSCYRITRLSYFYEGDMTLPQCTVSKLNSNGGRCIIIRKNFIPGKMWLTLPCTLNIGPFSSELS